MPIMLLARRYALIGLLLAPLALTACEDEGPAEEAGEAVDEAGEAVEDTGEAAQQ